MRLLSALSLPFALACAAVQAQGDPDPLAAPECVAARRQLDEALAAGGPRERLNAARREAARQCLGRTPPRAPEGRFDELRTGRFDELRTGRFDELRTGRFDELRTGRFVPPPVAVAPIPAPPPPVLAPVPAPPPPSALAIPRPPVITACDAAGCWDSSGARHNHQGPVLVGPRGLCTLQGGLLNCP